MEVPEGDNNKKSFQEPQKPLQEEKAEPEPVQPKKPPQQVVGNYTLGKQLV